MAKSLRVQCSAARSVECCRSDPPSRRRLASDTPSAPTYGNQPGYDTYREMRLMAESGVSLPAILQAATIINARQFGLDRDFGTVERGKIANLLLLKSNPLESIDAWSEIDRVILRGAALERESLAAGRSGS